MDIKRIKQLAGLQPIVEAWGDGDFDRFMHGDELDDDMSPAEREMAAAAERDLEAKGIKVKQNIDPEADLSRVAQETPPEDDELGAAPEMGAPPAMDEVPMASADEAPAPMAAEEPAVSEEPAAGGMSRGEKVAKSREYLTVNPGASRKEFMTFAQRELGVGANYANILYYGVKKKMAPTAPSVLAPGPESPMEFWVVKNASGKVLVEGSSYDLPMWANFTDTKMDARIFDNELHARKAVDLLAKYGFKAVEASKESVE